MFKNLRNKKQAVDPQTGEIQTTNYRITPPDLSHARTVEEVAGKNIEFINLKDHAADMDGQKVAIIHAQFKDGSGEYDNKPYVVMGVWLLDDNDKPTEPKVIMTGAENVLARVLAAEGVISDATPLIGTFHNHGRAWALD